MKRTIACIVSSAALVLGSVAEAAIPNIFGGAVACTVQVGVNAGERHCSGIFTTFDGAPIDVNVGFPPAPGSGPDGDFPIIGLFHGWGGAKESLTGGGLQQWLDAGYAVFSMSDRGWGNSCGGLDPNRLLPVCANGYNHLMDTRYEVRDAQEVFEALADQLATGAVSGEGLIDPQAIGVHGGSYGGGISMALGALKNRKMMGAHEGSPNADGYLVPWVSDGGKAMQIAAAQPDIPWTDMAYSLTPNGHTLDYVADAPYTQRGRIGVMKQSFVAGLYALGFATSNYQLPGVDPDADLTQWYAAINAGEPYDQNPLSQDITDEVTRHHSSYYIDDSTAPAPMLISNGWTDDLFPADEAIRFYNRTRTNHPGTPIALIFTDHGHQRGQNKGPDGTFRSRERRAWFDFYVKGVGSQPFLGVQTLTQTCGAPSGGATGDFDDPDTDAPFQASSWAALAPGEVRIESAAAQIISPTVPSDAPVGQAFDPISGSGACATASGADQTGAATYRSDPAPVGGFTLMGSPTIIADIDSPSPTAQLAVRLLDVDPVSGDQTLVARGLYRPEITQLSATCQVFQLHPNGWLFAEGHIAKLELLPADQPYGRNSNGQLPITVSNLRLQIPVLETPDGGLIDPPSPKVLPAGYTLASDFPPDVDGTCQPGTVPTATPTPTVTSTPPPGATVTPTPVATSTPVPTGTATPAAFTCNASPLGVCRAPAVPMKASVFLKDRSPDDKDRLGWKWVKGAATTKADFGTPLTTTSYALCIYDQNGLRLFARAPAGGDCGGKPCWTDKPTGFKYKDRTATPDGLTQIILKANVAGKAKILAKGKGFDLQMPTPLTSITQPVTVQMQSSSGVCWEAIYSAPPKKHTVDQFKDKAD